MWSTWWGGREIVYSRYGGLCCGQGENLLSISKGRENSSDWALDKEGERTNDWGKALEGVMLPMGGPKGSALSVMMDVFSGVFSGSAFAGHVMNPYDPSKAADVGHF